MNHIEIALEPRRKAAVQRALAAAEAAVNKALEELEDPKGACWDLDKAAPAPHGRLDRKTYKAWQAKRDFYRSITILDTRFPRRLSMRDPVMVTTNLKVLTAYFNRVEQAASLEFTKYVAKLTGKIGETTAASINASPLWNGSILTVTKPDGSVETWKTTMIINCSCLGKLFNQWPTRRVS